jgi:hypothetical protein
LFRKEGPQQPANDWPDDEETAEAGNEGDEIMNDEETTEKKSFI